MRNIGGLRALQVMVINERCCITGAPLQDGHKPAIIRIQRPDGVIMTINGNINKGVRKGRPYYEIGKVLSVIRNNVVMTIRRAPSGKIYADCDQIESKVKRAPRKGENLNYLKRQSDVIRKNVEDSRSKLQGIWN